MLGDVGLPQPERRLDDYPHQFSGGMRQRVMIAMAICTSPDILIADEPTTALDVTTQARIMEMLGRIVEERRMGMILITHDLGLASSFCDDIHVMYAGRIVESGSADAVLRTPAHPYSEALLDSICGLDRDVDRPIAAISGQPPLPHQLPSGCPFHPRCAYAQEICAEQPPPPVVVGPQVAECHFPVGGARRVSATRRDADRAEPVHDGEPLVVVDHLSRHFQLGGRRSGRVVKAVDDVSLVLKRGETLGLVGESGSGKSTLARLLLRLDEPTSGGVHFESTDLFAASPRELRRLRREMQIVFQDPYASLNKRKTVEQIVSFPLVVHDRSLLAQGAAARGSRSCSSSSVSGRSTRAPTRASSPAASASVSASRARSRSTRSSSCSTRPSRRSTSRSRRRSSTSCAAFRTGST